MHLGRGGHPQVLRFKGRLKTTCDLAEALHLEGLFSASLWLFLLSVGLSGGSRLGAGWGGRCRSFIDRPEVRIPRPDTTHWDYRTTSTSFARAFRGRAERCRWHMRATECATTGSWLRMRSQHVSLISSTSRTDSRPSTGHAGRRGPPRCVPFGVDRGVARGASLRWFRHRRTDGRPGAWFEFLHIFNLPFNLKTCGWRAPNACAGILEHGSRR